MQRERQRRTGRDERRGARRGSRAVVEPIVMSARRPRPEATVEPRAEASSTSDAELSETPLSSSVAATAPPEAERSAPPPRRSARIVASVSPSVDAARRERERLLARFMASEGRAMITRAATECARAGVEFPLEQAVQLQLLEHTDEACARSALAALGDILAKEAPLKRPILEQRLRRLEDTADEEATRSAEAELRRSLRA